MALICKIIVAAVITTLTAVAAWSQSVGTIEVSGRVKIGGKQEKLSRKRFYLFRGGLETNRALVDRMKTASFTPRDCFYCTKKASPELISWLKAGDCESPFCRSITAEEAAKVPEFAAAVQKGLRQYRNRPTVAREWLITNLSADLLSGLYRERKASLTQILGPVKPAQSSMTDSSSVVAIFVDVPVNPSAGKTTETWLVSNVVPIEFKGNSYLWACEVEATATKKVKLNLQVPDPGKTVRKCEVIVKPLPECSAAACPAK